MLKLVQEVRTNYFFHVTFYANEDFLTDSGNGFYEDKEFTDNGHDGSVPLQVERHRDAPREYKIAPTYTLLGRLRIRIPQIQLSSCSGNP